MIPKKAAKSFLFLEEEVGFLEAMDDGANGGTSKGIGVGGDSWPEVFLVRTCVNEGDNCMGSLGS